MTRPARIRAFARRVGAAALAASFALTAGLIALYPRLAAQFELPTPGQVLSRGVSGGIDLLVSIPKQLAAEITFYGPFARQILAAFDSLGALPRAALIVLQSPEAQLAGAFLLTLGVAIYWMLRPSRNERAWAMRAWRFDLIRPGLLGLALLVAGLIGPPLSMASRARRGRRPIRPRGSACA